MGEMSFRRYKRELYNRRKANLLHLKARMVESEIVEIFLYGAATTTLIKGHCNKFRAAYDRMLLRILGGWCNSPNNPVISYNGRNEHAAGDQNDT